MACACPGIGLFAAAIGGVLWNTLNSVMGWKYFTGGSGNEPPVGIAFIWGALTTYPVILIAVLAYFGYNYETLPANFMALWSRVIILYGALGGVAGMVFYGSGIRRRFESMNLGYAGQEMIIAATWSLTIAGLTALSLLWLYRDRSFRPRLSYLFVQVPLTVTLTVLVVTVYALFSTPELAAAQGRGIVAGLTLRMSLFLGVLFTIHSVTLRVCFISYSTKDQAFADRLHRDLETHGVRCWYAPQDIAGGERLMRQLEEAIGHARRLLLILSSASLTSEWVIAEISEASRQEAQKNKRMLFPIRLVDYETLKGWKCLNPKTGQDLAEDVRACFIPDFSNWTDRNSYDQAFQRLVRDLKTDRRRNYAPG